MSDFTLFFLAGRTIEHAVKDAIKQRYSVVMTANLRSENGHGPRAEDADAGIVLADLQLFRGARAGWIEVKGKSAPVLYRRWGRYEHGIDLVKWREYVRLQKESRQTVYLLVCEAQSADLLMQSLDTLWSAGSPRYGEFNGKKLINFDRSAFAHVGTMSLPVDDLRQLSVSIDWPVFESFVTQPMLIED